MIDLDKLLNETFEVVAVSKIKTGRTGPCTRKIMTGQIDVVKYLPISGPAWLWTPHNYSTIFMCVAVEKAFFTQGIVNFEGRNHNLVYIRHSEGIFGRSCGGFIFGIDRSDDPDGYDIWELHSELPFIVDGKVEEIRCIIQEEVKAHAPFKKEG